MTDSGQGVDVEIGGLGFKLAVSKERPYERATAQFRKEQFDSAPTVGDQSLSGWWTRGQLSFHKGAGVKYYEVLDGEEVLNKFQDSTGVNPWEPGEAMLSEALSTVAVTGVVDAVPALTDSVACLKDDGTGAFVNGTVGSTFTGWGGSSILSLASGPSVYRTTARSIEGPNVGASVTYKQLVPNPAFFTAGTTYTTTNISYASYHDYSAANFTIANGANRTAITPGAMPTVTGVTYYVVVEVSGTLRPYEVRLDDPVSGTVLDSGTKNRYSATFTATASGHSIHLCLPAGAVSTGVILAVDTFSVSTNPSPTPYPERDDHWTWDGTAHQSTSTYTIAPGDYYDLWLPPAIPVGLASWVKAWWAKGRLFALADTGKWYALPPASGVGVATPATDPFWAPGLGTAGWALTESPAGVYIAKGSDIYLLTSDSSGAFPVISTPTVAASMPAGETISVIHAYLGRMVICTNLGLRVAAIQQDGSLVYGARVLDGDFSGCARVTALGDLAYVVGQATGATTPAIYAINMADNEDLTPGFAKVRSVAAGTKLGAVTAPDGKVMAWDGSGFYRSATGYVTTGWIETGFHRLGTLEPKSFQYLRVKTEGTAGSVSVEAVLPNGTVTSIGSVSAGGSADLSLTTAIPSPQEYIALKFTMTGDGSGSPILLGYQLKALPAPKRQRMIRLPLLVMDVERRGGAPASGYEGSAWARLSALESMEQSGGTFTFTDFRTGETGEVFIESVEHRGETPPGDRSTGFGGTIFLTLRMLA